MSKDEPAFPLAVPTDFQWANSGITKREYFAAMAMAGRISFTGAGEYELCANHAVAHADALIAALAKGRAE